MDSTQGKLFVLCSAAMLTSEQPAPVQVTVRDVDAVQESQVERCRRHASSAEKYFCGREENRAFRPGTSRYFGED